VLTAQQIRISH